MKELFEGAIKFQEEDFSAHKDLYESLKTAPRPTYAIYHLCGFSCRA